MAFKGGGMRTLVRAHDEVPCITAIITPEIRRRISAHQHSLSGANAIPPYGDSQRESGNRGPPRRMGTLKESPATEVHPAVWGLSKRVRQPRPTQAAWPPLPKGGNLHPSTACQDGMQPRPVCSPWPKGGAYQKLSTLSPISLHYPSNKQPEPARGEFRLLL